MCELQSQGQSLARKVLTFWNVIQQKKVVECFGNLKKYLVWDSIPGVKASLSGVGDVCKGGYITHQGPGVSNLP